MKTHAFRLTRGQDLKESIIAYAIAHHIEASVVISSVGCVFVARLRDASGVNIQDIPQHMEIVSLTGTVSIHRTHLHAAFAKEDLSTIGGHLMPGCIINTTAEIVLLELTDTVFAPMFDGETGYEELNITNQGHADGQWN